MRDIVFRGKRVDNSEWVQGSLLSLDDGGYRIVTSSLIDFDSVASADMICSYAVEEESVGQYTGLEDDNGKPIFEGDIIHCTARRDGANMVVIFENAEFRMVLCEKYRKRIPDSGFYDISCFGKEVIGNIYDNPELLEE